MIASSRESGKEIPESLNQWLDKWQAKIAIFCKSRNTTVTLRASSALDELEFLLARTIENQVSE